MTLQYSFVKELHRVLEGLYFLDGMNPRKSKILWEIIDRAVNIRIYNMYIYSPFFPNSELLTTKVIGSPFWKGHFVRSLCGQNAILRSTWRWIAGDVEDEEDDGNDETVPWSC